MGNDSPIPEPEFLPPEDDFQAQPPSPPRPSWSYAPATYVLIGINCLVFLAMVTNHVSAASPTIDQLMYWGADNAGAVLLQGQWWRIVSAMFVHVGLLHLATNMWCLWNLGLLAEPLMGSMGMLAAYVLTGAAGNLLSTLVNWIYTYPEWIKYRDTMPTEQLLGLFPAGAGASGAVFGIAGVLIILLKSRRLPVPSQELHRLRRSVIYFAAINLVIGFSISFGSSVLGSGLRIDNMAHLGGFACGLLFAAPVLPRIGSSKPHLTRRLRLAIAMVVAMLVLFGFFLAQLPR